MVINRFDKPRLKSLAIAFDSAGRDGIKLLHHSRAKICVNRLRFASSSNCIFILVRGVIHSISILFPNIPCIFVVMNKYENFAKFEISTKQLQTCGFSISRACDIS